jgi:hypothetical protein
MYRQIRRIAERAGIKIKVHPHIFRHTRITNLMEKNIPESIIKKMMWGSLTSDMLATYGHLVSTSTDDALLEAAGIKRNERIEDNALAPRQCPVCHLINGPTSRFCSSCGHSLTEEAAASQAQAIAIADGEITSGRLPEAEIDRIAKRVIELQNQKK